MNEIKDGAKRDVIWYLDRAIIDNETDLQNRMYRDNRTEQKVEAIRILESIKTKVENDEI